VAPGWTLIFVCGGIAEDFTIVSLIIIYKEKLNIYKLEFKNSILKYYYNEWKSKTTITKYGYC
jgi:hypothetical protein